nr:potassium channel family protein [uncultured Allobaculum sp.]
MRRNAVSLIAYRLSDFSIGSRKRTGTPDPSRHTARYNAGKYTSAAYRAILSYTGLERGKTMNTVRNYHRMMKKTGGDKLLYSFLIFYFVDCALILWNDPSISSYGDALWMGFSVATTIGLGDYTVTTPLARILTILLGIYGAVVAAYIPGLIASSYFEKLTRKRKAVMQKHGEALQNLSQMSPALRKELSAQIRKENAA